MNVDDRKKYIWFGISGILLYVIAALLMTPIENLTNESMSLIVFSMIVSLATALLVYANEQREKRKCIFGAGRNVFEKASKKQTLMCSIIVFISSLIFFYIGFKYRMWYVAWISFLVAGIICGIMKHYLNRNKPKYKRIY